MLSVVNDLQGGSMADNVKARHDFELGEDAAASGTTGTNVFAFVHQLGTEDLVVTARNAQGKPVLCESQIQDGNVVLVTKQGGEWAHGDRILLMGSKDDDDSSSSSGTAA